MTEETLKTDTENLRDQSSQLGARFKSAREAMSLSQRDAASRLNLNVKFIAMMESGNYENSLPPTFIRGYLRSYARLLNVMEEELNAVIGQQEIRQNPAPTPSAPQVLLKASPKKTDRYIHWITYGVVLTLMVLVGTWWHSHAKYSVTDVPNQPEAQSTNPTSIASGPITNLATPNATSAAPTSSTTTTPSNIPSSDAKSSEENIPTAAQAATETPVATTAAPGTPAQSAQSSTDTPPGGEAPIASQPIDSNNTIPAAAPPSINSGATLDASQAAQDSSATTSDSEDQPKHKRSKKHDLAKMLASPEPGLEVGD